jgi:hypothetical protein
MPFQGVIGRIDALFDSVVGDDNAKGLSAMVIALILWGLGGGVGLALFLMLGIISMFAAFISILWVYTTSIMGLNFLMMLSPVFISLWLFKGTERIARAWAGSVISFCMQPILVLGFLYVLSSATTLDKLTELAKDEIQIRKYSINFGTEDDPSVLEFSAPGFTPPLYEIPTDFSATNVATDESEFIEEAYLSRQARDEYREAKINLYVKLWKGNMLNADMDNAQDVANKKAIAPQATLDTLSKFDDLFYTNGYERDDPESDDPDDKITSYAENAILHYTLETGDISMGGFLVYVIRGADYGTSDELHGVGFEDSDVFAGEPVNVGHNNLYAQLNNLGINNINGDSVGEFPNCKKYCPRFDPVYDPKDEATVNPKPNECKNFCMFLFDSTSYNMSYLVGAILAWIILNVLTGAFLAIIPEMARRLSHLQPFRNFVPDIFGDGSGKRGVVEESGDGFSHSEITGMQNPSAFIGLGVRGVGSTSGRPGVLMAALDKGRRIVSGGGQDRVDLNTGEIIRAGAPGNQQKSYWDVINNAPTIINYGGRNLSGNDQAVKIAEAFDSAKGQLNLLNVGGAIQAEIQAAFREVYQNNIYSTNKSQQELIAEFKEKLNAIAATRSNPTE